MFSDKKYIQRNLERILVSALPQLIDHTPHAAKYNIQLPINCYRQELAFNIVIYNIIN